ncbi:hypothetical protein [Phyllobacterium sp. YR531]|uniref:hypothetical protein n=1 Tax=Phyllobacterium sp. YR531 TaxID=1144343 RepID=UPI00026F98B2|nr:hypothetical protein [Phyllobacterium sp. YR531]EJN03649.1 hypothetical protein PMI41_02358 [Phyllobacterium sp. YR531]
MVQSINNAGSQQALESNWNDENAIRKFERATDGATRQRKHEILDTKQRPNSVELRANSKPLDEKQLVAPPEVISSSFTASATSEQGVISPLAIQAPDTPASNTNSRFIAASVALIVIAIISGVLYFA